MNQTTSGPAASSGAEAGAARLDAALDAFEQSLGLPASCPRVVESEATRLVSLTPDDRRRMSASDREEAAYILFQFAFFLQRAANRQQARMDWAEERTNRLVAASLQQTGGYGFTERRLLAVRGDEAASRLEEIRVAAKLRLDRISYLAGKVEAMARSLQPQARA